MTLPDIRPSTSSQSEPAASHGAPDWRTASAWWVKHELGSQVDGLIRIVDVRPLPRNEAWVAIEVAGHHVVVGLRHEVVGAPPQAPTAGDGWYRLLYLSVPGDAPQLHRPEESWAEGATSGLR